MKITDLHKGLWTAKNADLSQNMLISVDGEAPFLTLKAAIDLNEFAKGNIVATEVTNNVVNDIRGLIFEQFAVSIVSENEVVKTQNFCFDEKQMNHWINKASKCTSDIQVKALMLTADDNIPEHYVNKVYREIYEQGCKLRIGEALQEQ